MGKVEFSHSECSDTMELDREFEPRSLFPDGFRLDKTEFKYVQEFQYHRAVKYAKYEQGSLSEPYSGNNYFMNGFVPSSDYLNFILTSTKDLYSVTLTDKNRILDRKYEKENEFHVYDENRRDANGKQIPGYKMKPEFELEFIKHYKEVNQMTDDDFQYVPKELIKGINDCISSSIQRLAWSIAKKDSRFIDKQINQFTADFIFAWNNVLSNFESNKVAEFIPVDKPTTSTNVAGISI